MNRLANYKLAYGAAQTSEAGLEAQRGAASGNVGGAKSRVVAPRSNGKQRRPAARVR